MKRNLHAGMVESGGLSLNILTDDELDEIHLATLEILKNTGVFVEDKEAIEIFDAGGAIIDRKSMIVKIPPYVVEDAVHSAPSALVLTGRNSKDDFIVGSGRIGFANFGKAILIVDPYSDEIRKTTKTDVADAAKIIDYLSDMDVFLNAVTSHDVSQEKYLAQLHNAEAAFQNTTKNVFIAGGNSYILEKLIEMAAVIVGGKDKFRQRPILTLVVSPVSPLKLIKECCEIIIRGARFGIPMDIISMAMAGGSSPITLAGAMVTHNAEVLSAIVLSQLANRGTPVIYGSSTTAMDMKFATAAVGSPEAAVINAAVARLAQYYSLPSFVSGILGDSKISDIQAGHEKTLTGLLPALAGANLIYGAGILETGITFSFAQAIIDNEIARMIKHIINGIPVNDETMAVDVIKEIGPFKDFLSHRHTFKHMRDHFQPKFIDRRMREDWDNAGRISMYERAKEEAKRILETYKPEALSDGVRTQIRSIIEAAENEMGGVNGKN